MARLLYTSGYDMGFPGLSALHPFDVNRASNVMRNLRGSPGLESKVIHVDREVSEADLALVHSREHLRHLRQSKTVAQAVEISLLSWFPRFIVDRALLKPMRRATQGTILGAKAAIEHGLAVNLAGGFHHAKPAQAEGFCLYADVGVAVRVLRRDGLLGETDKVAYIDLDAHLGNGVAHVFMDDPKVGLFDMYNGRIYPIQDRPARERVDKGIPLRPHMRDAEYLGVLKRELPLFLDWMGSETKLAVYNAGTDIFDGDEVGQLGVSLDGVLERDRFVLGELKKRGLPTLMLPSGGYTKQSAGMVSRSIRELVL